MRISLSGCATVSSHHFRCILSGFYTLKSVERVNKNINHTLNASCTIINLFLYSQLICFILMRVWMCICDSERAHWGVATQFRAIKEGLHKLPASWQHLNAHPSAPSAPKDLRQEKVTCSFHFIVQFFKILLLIFSFVFFKTKFSK